MNEKDSFWDERERFDTPDGDFFDVDFKRHDYYKQQGMGRHVSWLGIQFSFQSQ